MKVVLDTNFLLIPNQFGVDVFEFLSNYEIATLSSCVDELKGIAKKKGKDGTAARVALGLLDKKNVEIIKTKEKGDRAVLNYALHEKCAVGTNDRELIKALKNKGVKVIRLRQKRYLSED